MNKKLLFITLLSFGLTSRPVFSQKVDLDRFYVQMNYQNLPQLVIPKEERTYGVGVKTGGAVASYISNESIYDRIILQQWEKVENDPLVGVDLSLEDFLFRDSKVETKVVDTRDDKGKVTSSTTTYYVTANFTAKGSMQYVGPQPPPDPKVQQKQKEAEEKKAANPFLANVSTTSASTDDKANRINLSQTYTYKSEEYSSSQKASENFRNNKDAIYNQYLRKFVDEAIGRTNHQINIIYGFPSLQTNELLWILNAKDHPEYQLQQQAIEAIKVLFVNQKATDPIDETRANIQPLIVYLESLKEKYNGTDKGHKKMRYSVYYNLSKIYLFLDETEKARENANLLIENDYDPKDGVKLNEQIDQVIADFKRTSLTSRHGN